MKFTPRTDQELDMMKVAPEGEYDFEILEATDETSQAGNDMIKIVIGVYNGERLQWRVTDYLMEKVEYKLRHCCDTVGLLGEYEKGNIEAMYFVGLTGKVKLKIKPEQTVKKTDGSTVTYKPKNEVSDYVKRTADTKPVTKRTGQDDTPASATNPDGLPF